MGVKQTLLPDHIPTNKYTLIIAPYGPITFTKISGIEQALDVAELPDRTMSPGGNVHVSEFTAEQPMHHTAQVIIMETWFAECQDPISNTAKKAATLVLQSGIGNRLKTFTMTGLWPKTKKTPDLDYASEGDMAVIEWTFSLDNMLPI